jgi:hypothetical protein
MAKLLLGLCDYRSKRFARLKVTWQKHQLHAKSVPSQEETGTKWYIIENSLKSRFQLDKWCTILTSEQGVMTILLKVAQKLRRRVWTEEDCMNASTSWPFTSQRGLFSSYSSQTHLGELFLV